MENSSEMTETPAVFRSARGKNLALVSERTAAPSPQPDIAARESALREAHVELDAALATVRAAFAILGARALVILAALGSAGAFAWALYDPQGWRAAAACLFTAMVFWPALWMDRRTP